MRRWISAVVCGVAAWGALGQVGGELEPLGVDSTVAERAGFYETVARVDSTATLDELIRRVAALAPSDVRRFQLEALVQRYVELDAQQAVRQAVALVRSGDHDLASRLYERLGRVDMNAALSALSQIDDPDVERLAASALLRALGDDLRALELVSAALHGIDADEFRANGLMRIARSSPREAFGAALALRDPGTRRRAAVSIMASWMAETPDDAIDAFRNVEDPLVRAALASAIPGSLRTAESIVVYLDTLEDAEYRQALETGILGRLAQADPVAATEIVARLPPGDQRRQLEVQVATVYAQKDPAGALQWARSRSEGGPELVLAIVRGVAFTDPLRAFDLSASLDEPARSRGLLTVVGMGGGEKPFPALASRVLQLPEDQTRTAAVASLLSAWAMGPGKAVEALSWAVANAAAVPPEAFERLGHVIARADPVAAASYLDRVPSAGRASWLSAVTVSYALKGDPQAALSFIERYRGDPDFDRAATALAPHLARTDPPAAVRLLGSVGTRSDGGFGAELQIAREWMQIDPAAAAAWAIELPPLQRNAVLGMVTTAWGMSDRDSVRRWALSMPAGDKRDAALAGAVRAFGAEPDAELMGAFSDDRARQAAMMSVVLTAATADRAAARRLLETYVSDPRMRAQGEQMIETMPRGPISGFSVPASMIRDPVTGVALPLGMAPPGVGPGGPPPSFTMPPSGPVFLPGPPTAPLPAEIVIQDGPAPRRVPPAGTR